MDGPVGILAGLAVGFLLFYGLANLIKGSVVSLRTQGDCALLALKMLGALAAVSAFGRFVLGWEP